MFFRIASRLAPRKLNFTCVTQWHASSELYTRIATEVVLAWNQQGLAGGPQAATVLRQILREVFEEDTTACHSEVDSSRWRGFGVFSKGLGFKGRRFLYWSAKGLWA